MGWTEAEVINKTKEFTASIAPSKVVIVKGSGVKVWDINGKEYLDCSAGPGVLGIGHCHPRVTEVIKKQVEALTQCPGKVYNVQIAALAEKLAEITPGSLKKSFFCNSGAEAVEGAVKIALKKAHKSGKGAMGIIALQHSFHGRLSLSLSLTGLNNRKRGFGPFSSFPGIVHVQAPYCYRCRLKYPECDINCAELLNDVISCNSPGEFAIFIGEPILGTGGIIVPPDGYWQRVKQICDKNNIIFIFDEVFTGFGRTGKMFASQHWGIVPDIMTMAKTLGGGLPIGGFIMKPEIADALDVGDHYTTFGWNNVVASAAGLECIKVIEEEGVVENCRAMGELMLQELKEMAEASDIMGDVRGRGLFIGVELVKDKKTREPHPEAAKKLVDALMQRGVILDSTGAWSNNIRIAPPLIITKEHVRQFLSAMELALKDIGHPLRVKSGAHA
jgi:4-aminobutyrate aminotransferase/(S)-3-amino-2-methylpropionate transaminase